MPSIMEMTRQLIEAGMSRAGAIYVSSNHRHARRHRRAGYEHR